MHETETVNENFGLGRPDNENKDEALKAHTLEFRQKFWIFLLK